MTPQSLPLEEGTSSEKLWLLAGELLRDEGIEDVNASHLATLIGQVLACVAIYSTIDPLDPRTIRHVVELGIDSALNTHENFLAQVNEP